jgi:pimeloyl-ACP methyl ester carboxylesterase
MLAFTHPRYSLTDIHNFYESAEFSERTIRDELYAYDARTRPMQFDVPIVIVEGTEDMVTPAPYIRRYFDDIRAPAKSFALVRGGGHSVIVTRPAEFLDSMLAALKLVRVPLWQAPTSRPH